MQKQTILELLSLVNSKPAPSQNRQGWVIAKCPFAPWLHESGKDEHPSFGVTISNGASKFNCFSCQQRGELYDLIRKIRDVKGKDQDPRYKLQQALELVLEQDEDGIDIPEYKVGAKFGTDEVSTIPFSEEWLSTFMSAAKSPDALAYLKTRQINAKVAKKLDLRFDTHDRRVCFPYYDRDGVFAGLHGRAIDKDNPLKYKVYLYNGARNPNVWCGEEFMDLSKPLLIVESVFDWASALRVYDNVICSRSAGIPHLMINRIKGAVEVVTLYDNDKGGDMARKALSKNITNPLLHLKPPEGVKDPGEMTIEQLRGTLGGFLDLQD